MLNSSFIQCRSQKIQKSLQYPENQINKIKLDIYNAAKNNDAHSIIGSLNHLSSIERYISKGNIDDFHKIKNLRKKMLSILEEQNGMEKIQDYLDKDLISPPEIKAFHLASSFGILDKKTANKYYQDGLNGVLTDYQKGQIKELQLQLKEDGLYEGKIDGIFGPISQKALEQLIEENTGLKEIKEKFLENGIIGALESLQNKPAPNPSSNRNERL